MRTSLASGFGLRWTDLSSLALVVATAAAGLVVLPDLPAEMVVGWHYGLDGRVSRTYGPRIVGLVVLPAVTAGVFVALRAGARAIAAAAPEDRGYPLEYVYEAFVHLVLACLCGAQAFLLALNL